MRTRRSRWMLLGGVIVVAAVVTLVVLLTNGGSTTGPSTAATGPSHGHSHTHRGTKHAPPGPISLQAKLRHHDVVVSWKEPKERHAKASSYTVTYAADGVATKTIVTDRRRVELHKLRVGHRYTVVVRGTNRLGTGPSSTVHVVPATVPPAPDLSVNAQSGQLEARWHLRSNGGAAVTAYELILRHHGTHSAQLLSASTQSTTLTGLSNGTRYGVTLRAINQVGKGHASAQRATPASAPAAVTGVTVTPAHAQLKVTWSPAVDNGSKIVRYVVKAVPSHGSTVLVHARGRHALIKGLSEGTSYSVTVTAVNARGAGPASAAVAGTPADRPSAPGDVKATASAGAVAVTWKAPAKDGGDPVTGYVVSLTGTGSAAPQSQTVTVTHASFAGLAPDSYTVEVQATTAAGAGSRARTTAAVPAT